MAAGVNEGGGSRIELLDRGNSDRVSGTSTGAPEHEHGIPLEGEQPGQNIPDLYSDTRKSGGGGHEDRGTVAKRLSVIPAKRTPNDDQPSEDTQYTVQSGGSGGERQRPNDTLASTDVYQLQGGTGMT